MIKVYNNIIPFKGFLAINLFGFLFIKKKYAYQFNCYDENHEAIHTKQMRELLYIFFYIIYLLEWLWRVLFTKDRFTQKAYRNISFEKEAFKYEKQLDYLKTRKLFAMWRND